MTQSGTKTTAAKRSKPKRPTGKRSKPKQAFTDRAAFTEVLKARFDAAQTTVENRQHWSAADTLSADAALSPAVRQMLRSRARYEVDSNPLLKGMVLTAANHFTGTGPKLNMLIPEHENVCARVERDFWEWTEAIRWALKIRTMRQTLITDGEAIQIFGTNPTIDALCQLDVSVVDVDRLATPFLRSTFTNGVDGIELDAFGNPAWYYLLRHHPGDISHAGALFEYDRLPAAQVCHWFRADRPEQHRGLPEIAASLESSAVHRRWKAATLAAAEEAAKWAIIMTTTHSALQDVDPWTPGDTLELGMRILTALPQGWDAKQLQPQHPATTHREFNRENVNDIARPLNMPLNVALANSADYNYASGRMDHQVWYKDQDVRRDEFRRITADPTFYTWLREMRSIYRVMYSRDRTYEIAWQFRLDHEWHWDGQEHVDPAKNAKATEILMRLGLLTEAEYHAKRNRDWRDIHKQLGVEAKSRTKGDIPQLVAPAKGAELAAALVTEDTAEEVRHAVS